MATPKSAAVICVTVKTARDDHGVRFLQDLYVDGAWIGSRRTPAQCSLAIQHEITKRLGEERT